VADQAPVTGTTDGALPEPGYAAGAPRPAVGFSIDLPDHWVALDLDPATSDRWLDAFLDRQLAGRPNAAAERGPARAALRQLLARLRQQQVFLAAILVGEIRDEPVSASVTLAWRRPELRGGIDLDAMGETFARAPSAPGEDLRARRARRVAVEAGDAITVATLETQVVPGGGGRRRVALTQWFVPVLDTGWLAVITTATPVLRLAAAVEDVGAAAVASLRFDPPGP
jgi:hypothetical protein